MNCDNLIELESHMEIVEGQLKVLNGIAGQLSSQQMELKLWTERINSDCFNHGLALKLLRNDLKRIKEGGREGASSASENNPLKIQCSIKSKP
jgi:hypothetical protein